MENPEQAQPKGLLASLRDARRRLGEMKLRARKRLVRPKEVTGLIGQVRNELSGILPPESDAFRVYDRRTTERNRSGKFWRTQSRDGYATEVDERELDFWADTIDQILDTLSEASTALSLDAKDEHILRVGETFKAKSLVWEVMRGATSDLEIADQYLDEQILPFLESVGQGVSVHLVTGSSKPAFSVLLATLQQTHPKIEAKVHADCHDRFFIADHATVWHLGASFNGLGKAETLLIRMRDPAESKKLLDDFGTWWLTGVNL